MTVVLNPSSRRRFERPRHVLPEQIIDRTNSNPFFIHSKRSYWPSKSLYHPDKEDLMFGMPEMHTSVLALDGKGIEAHPEWHVRA